MKSNGGTQYYQQDRVYMIADIALCIPSSLPGGSYMYLMRNGSNSNLEKQNISKQDD